MHKSFLSAASVLTVLVTTSCSTIFTQGNKGVKLNSNPDGATVTIRDEDGATIFEGTTPTKAKLRTGEPYFARKSYTLTFSKAGHQDVTTEIGSTISPWYFGNIILGGLVGMLVVDPLTGAVYTLPGEQQVTLPASSRTANHESGATLKIADYRDISESGRRQLVRLN